SRSPAFPASADAENAALSQRARAFPTALQKLPNCQRTNPTFSTFPKSIQITFWPATNPLDFGHAASENCGGVSSFPWPNG
ncbi:MAG: hypothetical protein J0M17_20820, partial [Planctomycetes bacterium]|nr:hypothetical protein [Planctomycetota bacterium]